VSPESPGDFWARVLRAVEQRGFTTVGVLDDPVFAYTVGLPTAWQHPEIIVFGLPFEVADPLLGDIAARVARGETFRTRRDYYGLLQEYPVRFVPVAPDAMHEHLTVATRYHADGKLSAMQLVWPDLRGQFVTTMRSQPIIAPPGVEP
jgi:hypothetical protein